jgi:hypothetical protein
VHVGNNIVEDVLLDGGFRVIIRFTKDFKKILGLPIPRPAPYTLRMVDQTLTKQVCLIKDFKIHIHGIPYM